MQMTIELNDKQVEQFQQLAEIFINSSSKS